MNPVSARTNQIEANYYSSKQSFTGGGTVRDWLTRQSFADQYSFGIDVFAQIQRGGDPVTDVDASRLLSQFAEDAGQWDSLVGSDAKRANRVFDRLHTLAKELRQVPAGRAGLLALTSHEIEGVRLLAATECLAWSPEVAVPTLEAIEGSIGLHAVSAKYTLRSYRAGTLDLDW